MHYSDADLDEIGRMFEGSTNKSKAAAKPKEIEIDTKDILGDPEEVKQRILSLKQRLSLLKREHPLRAEGQDTLNLDETFHSYSHYTVEYSRSTVSNDDIQTP